MFEISTKTFRSTPTDAVPYYPRAFGRLGAVAAEHYSATLAGIEILRQGGNAIDAACAATLVEGVVNPQMHTIGGELPILLSIPGFQDVICINGNMAAPEKATPDAFRNQGYESIPAEGVLAAGVPGAFGAIVEALSRFGRLRFEDVSARAIDLAKNGFPAHSGLIRQYKSGIQANFQKFLIWPGTAEIYLPNGRVPQEGALIRNPALAAMYSHLTEIEQKACGDRRSNLRAVLDGFYRGDIAAEIVRFVKQRGGLLERSDFDKFQVPVEKSVHINFHGAEIHKCGPWNQGPVMLQTLAILKSFDIQSLGQNSSDYIHMIVEAMKLAYADREQFYGDPAHVNVPLDILLSDSYGALRASLIEQQANAEIRPGDPMRGRDLLPPHERLGGATWGSGTVHVDAMDADGFTAAFTPSGGWIRSSEVIPALGFPLSMRLSNCYLEPANHPNVVAPFKRPRTTISPSLVLKEGRPWMAFGSMGGDQQDQWQLQFVLNRLVFGMSLQESIEAPKFSSEHFPSSFAPHDFFLNRLRVEPGVGDSTITDLRKRGHIVDVALAWSEGFLCATERNLHSGVLEAGCDPRGTKSEVFPACALAI